MMEAFYHKEKGGAQSEKNHCGVAAERDVGKHRRVSWGNGFNSGTGGGW